MAAQGQAAPPAEAPQPGEPSSIVVQGRVEEKSDWKRAEGDHVVLFSTGSEGEVKRVTRNLELLHRLMARRYSPRAMSDPIAKLQITLVDSGDRLRAMGLTEQRAQEGPFPASFPPQRYYDPREDGEVLVIARTDQVIDINTTRRFNLVCDDIQANGTTELCGASIKDAVPVPRSWEAGLYSAFAQHFLLTYTPTPYPRWYMDGIGALFSTILVNGSGTMDYARAPERFKDVFQAYGYPDVAAILTGRYLAEPKADAGWSPYGAWLLTHYFVFSKLKPERASEFRSYMTAIGQGVPMATAAQAFHDMKALQRDVQSHANRDIAFAHTAPPEAKIPDPLMTRLSASSGALVEAQLAEPPAGAAAGAWLDGYRRALAAYANDREAMQLLARAECRSGKDAECLATAERMLAKAPDDAVALAWKGVALTDQAIAGPAPERAGRLTAARMAIRRALSIDDQATLALIAYFQSYAKAGEPLPDDAMRAMAAVIQANPAAPAPRLYLARELVRQGQTELARRLLAPVLNGPFESSERKAAEALLAQPGRATPGS